MLEEVPITEWIKFLKNICSLSDPEEQGWTSRKLQLLESEGPLPRKERDKITSVHTLCSSIWQDLKSRMCEADHRSQLKRKIWTDV